MEKQDLLLDQLGLQKDGASFQAPSSEAEAASCNLAETGNNWPEVNGCLGLPEEAIYKKTVLCACRKQWDRKKEKRNIVLGHLGWNHSTDASFLDPKVLPSLSQKQWKPALEQRNYCTRNNIKTLPLPSDFLCSPRSHPLSFLCYWLHWTCF